MDGSLNVEAVTSTSAMSESVMSPADDQVFDTDIPWRLPEIPHRPPRLPLPLARIDAESVLVNDVLELERYTADLESLVNSYRVTLQQAVEQLAELGKRLEQQKALNRTLVDQLPRVKHR